MARKFTKYPSEFVQASRYGNEIKSKYETVGDLINALSKFPSDYPINLVGQYGWGVNPPDNDLCFIKEISDSGDSCDIYLI